MSWQDWIKWMPSSQSLSQCWTLQYEPGGAVSGLVLDRHEDADTVTVDIRQKAIEVALSVVSGAYQTSLLSYFTHRDLFPSLMKVRNIICWHVQADVSSLFKILIPLLAHLSLL